MEAIKMRAYLLRDCGPKVSELHGMPADRLADSLCFSLMDRKRSSADWIEVGTAEVSVQLFQPADLTTKQVSALRAQAKALQADTQMKLTRIEAEISKLLAITNEVQG